MRRQLVLVGPKVKAAEQTPGAVQSPTICLAVMTSRPRKPARRSVLLGRVRRKMVHRVRGRMQRVWLVL